MKRLWYRLGIFWIVALMLQGACSAAIPTELVPGGAAIGLRLQTDGVYITEFAEHAPAKAAGLKIGDRIAEIDGIEVSAAADLEPLINRANGNRVTVQVQRGERLAAFSVQPQRVGEQWRLGLYVKDSVAGIGTLTYYDPESERFGALGHAVNGKQSQPIRICGGEVLPVELSEIRRGESGKPGSLTGRCPEQAESMGDITENLPEGVFGRLNAPVFGQTLPVAEFAELETGPACILCTVQNGPPQQYDVEITKVQPRGDGLRTLQLRVTDPLLLEQTGGIVQGISGAPILQGGKLIGAVTHVLIDEPDRGYGIFIGDMLEASVRAQMIDVAA